jgi:protein gp37
MYDVPDTPTEDVANRAVTTPVRQSATASRPVRNDLFHARVPLGFVRDVFAVIAGTPQHTYQVLTKRSTRLRRAADRLDWPPNLWMGVSVEDDSTLVRLDDLRTVPAAVRFASCEPLLGPLDTINLDGIGWVIAGGESGPQHRPMDPRWAAQLRDRCLAAGVAFFFKQWGGRTPKAGGRMLEGRTWDQLPAPALPLPPDHLRPANHPVS